ncbi:MAG TPA: sensor histidine kinase [Chitinophagaceae bacterium]|nr:sensor histidine kinase [Chitinophagaceae bacterium]
MTINKKILQVIIHIAVWTGFLLLPFVSFSGSRESPFVPERKIQFLYFTTNLLLMGFYYLHSLVLIPRLLAGRKIFLYILSILGLMAFFIWLPYIYFHFVEFPAPRFSGNPPFNGNQPPRPFPHNGGHRSFFSRRFFPFTGTLFLFLLILIISGGIKVINQWFRSERRNEEIERERVTTELALLKSQINPHFFFNTLNNIYSLAVTNSPGTASAVMKLSNIMRYVLDDAKNTFVPLNKEIQFVENYIALQKERLTDKATVYFSSEGNTADKQIAPLLLIAFVENAFKYGISTHQDSAITIALKASDGQLDFTVTNQKFQTSMVGISNTGIGLRNTKRRLELLYPEKHSLRIDDDKNAFHVHLILDLI